MLAAIFPPETVKILDTQDSLSSMVTMQKETMGQVMTTTSSLKSRVTQVPWSCSCA